MLGVFELLPSNLGEREGLSKFTKFIGLGDLHWVGQGQRNLFC